MKKFLVNTSLFALLALLLCVAVELYLLTVSNEYSYKRKYVEENGDRIKVLILGHSQANQGIDPEELGDSAFNMSITGRNHYYDAVLAERYIPALKNLECVIWPLGYNSQYVSFLYPCEAEEDEEGAQDLVNTYKCMYEKYMGVHPPRSFPYRYWSEILNSRLAYGDRLFTKDRETLNGCTEAGFRRMEVKSKSSNWKTMKSPVIIDYDNPNAPLALAEGLDDFKRIAKVCHDNNVRLVVVTTPCYSASADKTTERGLREMYDCIDTMRTVYPSLEYYNYMDDERFRDDDFFFDISHMTEAGAKVFSQILYDEVLSSKR